MTGLKVLQFGLFLILLGFTVNLFSMALFVVALLISLTMQSMEALELSGQIIAWGSLSFPVAWLLSGLGKFLCVGAPEEGARNYIVASVVCDLCIGGAIFGMFKSLSAFFIGMIAIFVLVFASYILFLKFLGRLGENIGEPRVAGLVSLLFKLIFASFAMGISIFFAPAVGGLTINLTGFFTTLVFNYTIYLLFRAMPLYISEVEAGITDPLESGEARNERERKERMEGPKGGGGPAKTRPPEEPQGTPPDGHLLYRIPKALEPLHLAVKEGDRFKVETQLAQGADCNQTVRHGLTPLHIAASVGVMDVADALIKAGARVDALCEKGLTPIYFAIQTGNPNIVGFFINKGANLFHKNEDGYTPLHWACCAPHPGLVGPTRTKMVQLLISQGGDLMAKTNAGKTPRDLAVENQLEELVSAIDRHMGSSSPTPLKSFEQPPGQVSTTGAVQEHTAFKPFLGTHLSTMPKELSELLAAVKEGEPDKIKRQIVQGADINETTTGGIAPIHITAITGVMSGTDLLLSLGANVDDTCDHNLTPLFLAVHANNVNMVGYLKSRGANLNHRDELGRTALHWAAAAPTERLGGQNRPKMVEFLLNQGADPSIQDNDGQTALNLAQAAGEEEVVSMLGGAAESEGGQGPKADDEGYYV